MNSVKLIVPDVKINFADIINTTPKEAKTERACGRRQLLFKLRFVWKKNLFKIITVKDPIEAPLFYLGT